MRPISKLALFITIAGAVAFVLTHTPATPRETKSPERKVEREQSEASVERHALQVPGPVAKLKQENVISSVASRISPTRVTMPAIRGVNNYGWVQLPRGTQVDLVRQHGRELWVRWDGTVVKVDSSAAEKGAVLVRSSKG